MPEFPLRTVRVQSVVSALALVGVVLAGAGCDPPLVSIEETPIKTTNDEEGAGPAVKVGDLVRVDYRIMLPDGATLLQYEDYQFSAGEGTVIEGIDEAVIGMRAGGERTFTCPPQKHWGRAGHGNGAVPPNVTLTIELKVKSISK